MTDAHEKPIPSKVAFMKHPLHPILVVFPIAFLIFVLVTDAVFWWRAEAFWAEVSFWLALSGFSLGVFAAILGAADFMLVPEARRHVSGWSHFMVGVMTLALAGTNVALRWEDPAGTVVPWGILVSVVTALMVSITGWLGGTLTFHHGIGTYGNDADE